MYLGCYTAALLLKGAGLQDRYILLKGLTIGYMNQ